MIAYELLAPEGRCLSPDGHECTELFTMGGRIPVSALCSRCGKAWAIVTFGADA